MFFLQFFDVRLPPNCPTQIRLQLVFGPLAVSTCVAAHFFFTSCPKDPHYVLGHCLIYIIILNDHVLWYIGLTVGCLVPIVCKL